MLSENKTSFNVLYISALVFMFDLSKEPMYYMHKSVLSKTSPTNELGLMPYLRPKLLIQRTGQ